MRLDIFDHLHLIKDRKPRLCFTGSRDASLRMIEWTRQAVRHAMDYGWWIVAGDAKGIDRAVCMEAWMYARQLELGYTPLTVYGVEDLPRNGWWPDSYIRANVDINDDERWKKRDEVMVLDADACLGIWNGESSGTAYTMWFAQNKASRNVLCAKFPMPTPEELGEAKQLDLFTAEEKTNRRKAPKRKAS